MIKSIEKYSNDIYKAIYNKKDIEEEAKILFDSFQSPNTQLESYQTESLNDLFERLNERISKLFEKLPQWASSVYQMGSKKVYDARGNTLKLEIPKYEMEVDELVKNNMQLVKNVTEEQRQILIEEVKKGIKNGQSFKQTGEKIQERIKEFSLNRSTLIANTETSRAHTYAQEKTMVENGIEKYQWISAADQRVAPLDASLHRKVFNFGETGEMNWKGKDGKTYVIPRSPRPVRDTHPRCRCIIVAVD